MEPRFRGTVWLDELEHIRQTYGADVLERAMAGLSEADREALAHVMPISWVEVGPVMRCKNAVAAELDIDGDELQRRLVRAGVERTVQGFWRFLVRRLWDDALAKRLPILYSRTFEFGELRVEHIGGGRANLRLVGWPGMHDYDVLGLATGLETIFDLAGRADTSARFWKVKHGTETCFDVRWNT